MKIYKEVFFTLSIVLCSYMSYSQVHNLPVSEYHLKISEENLRLVEIEASLVVQEPYLEMIPWGFPPEIEGGWAKFVDLIAVTDENGKAIDYNLE